MVTESKDKGTQPAIENLTRHWLRVLRPFGWWFLLVLVLFGIRTHQRLMEQTRLLYFVTLEDQHGLPTRTDAFVATFDGRAIESGQMIPLGWHTFNVSHPKGEPFTTNLFVWYGGRGLSIDLKRAMGTLVLQVEPKATALTIRGLEFTRILSDTSGGTLSLPTDAYTIDAQYAHWHEQKQVTVLDRMTNSVQIAPRFGALSLSCNRNEAHYELLTTDNRTVGSGSFPETITELPEGTYKLITQHHRNRREENLRVNFGTTNDFAVSLAYGIATLATVPTGATVVTSDGREWGTTPLTLGELPVGFWNFTFRLDGYEPASVSLGVLSNETVRFSTNLVGRNYQAAMNAAEQFFLAGDYGRAEGAANEALLAKPNDPNALKLRDKALGYAAVAKARALGNQGDYIAGAEELLKAQRLMPGNEEVTRLLADFIQREPAQLEQMRKEQVDRVNGLFDKLTKIRPEAKLFERHELTTRKPSREAAKAIENALWNLQPHFAITDRGSTTATTFAFEAVEELPDGLRRCLVAGGKTRMNETTVIFEVLEYKDQKDWNVDQHLRVSRNTHYIPIHSSRIPDMTDKQKAQVKEGKQIVTEHIQKAIQ